MTVSLTATDSAGGSGVDKTYYTTNGTTPTTASTVYTAPFTVASTSTVKFFSRDLAGNAEAVQSQLVQIDSVAPTTTISCNNAACTGFYKSVTISLTATDGTGGSGVDKTYYTTNGTTPTTASTVYTAPFTVASTSTVKFFSRDLMGNSEAVKSQVVQIDTKAPTTTIKCNSAACATTAYPNSVSVSLASIDGSGGSGVSSTHYTTDGSDPTLSSPTYTTPFALTSSATVKYRSWDTAGNVEVTKSQAITVAPDAAPNVVLTVTPPAGPAPLSVTADASGSTDTDAWPIADYTYNWGDGTNAVTTTASTSTHSYAKTGTFTVTVTVRDTAGLTGTATKQVISQTNLVGNPGFESNTSGWATGTSGISLTRQLGGHSGRWAGQVQNTGTTAKACSLTDSPNWVNKTAAGTYTASLWVRGASAGATLTWQVRELNGATVVRTASKTIVLTTAWQQITLSYSALQPGVTSLDFSASVPAVPSNAIAFYADDAAVVLGP